MAGAALNNIYNYYLTTYAPKSITKYDTHKKSELRSLYNSMVNLNKESPLYLIPNVKESASFAVGIKESARDLRHNIANLGGVTEDALFNQKTASSSNEDLLSAAFIGDFSNGDTDTDIPSIEMGVTALASNQVNLGKYLASDAEVAMPADTYSFDLGINDLNYEFQFSLLPGETNKNLQERLSRLINNTGLGLKAEVVPGDNNSSSLRIESDATGLTPGNTEIFTVSDERTSKTSGMVDYFGLDYVSKPAANAAFTMNGEAHEAYSNNFTIGKLYEITLNGLSRDEDDTATIGIKPDYESLADNVESLFGSYNSFVSSVESYRDVHPSASRLMGEMHSIASLYQESFQNVGLSLQEDGTFAVDRDMIGETAQNTDGAAQLRVVKDFMNQLYRKTSQISLNPMQYVDKTVVAYKNPGHNYTAPYVTSNYSGMMFNYYC